MGFIPTDDFEARCRLTLKSDQMTLMMSVFMSANGRPVPSNIFEFVIPMHPCIYRRHLGYLRRLGLIEHARSGDYRITPSGKAFMLAQGWSKSIAERHYQTGSYKMEKFDLEKREMMKATMKRYKQTQAKMLETVRSS